MPTENQPVVFLEEVDRKQPTWEKSLQLNGIHIIDAHICPTYFPEHSHPQIKIAVPLENSLIQVKWQTAGGIQKQQSIDSQQVSIIPSYLPREIVWQKESSLLSIYLATDVVTHATEIGGETVEIVENWTANDPLIKQLGLTLRSQLQQGELERLYVESMANFLAVHLYKHYSAKHKPLKKWDGGLPNHQLRQVNDYIHDYLDQDLSLVDLAALVQMSQHHFARLFKQSTGFTPHQYVIRCRVERAKQLIIQGELTIAQVAYTVGFAHQSHLNRHFKRLLGVTPKTLLE